MIAIIDIQQGNVHSVMNALRKTSVPFQLISCPSSEDYDGYILPGVGNFDTYMETLNTSGFSEYLKHKCSINKPILGICVGMHALANFSQEGKLPGLGLISGVVKKIDTALPIPHMGWNGLNYSRDHPILKNIELETGFYYLHSYSFNVSKPEHSIALSFYGSNITAIVNAGNTYGVQFHPEKSHTNGLNLFKNFWEITQDVKAEN